MHQTDKYLAPAAAASVNLMNNKHISNPSLEEYDPQNDFEPPREDPPRIWKDVEPD